MSLNNVILFGRGHERLWRKIKIKCHPDLLPLGSGSAHVTRTTTQKMNFILEKQKQGEGHDFTHFLPLCTGR